VTVGYKSLGEALPDLDPSRLEHEGSRQLLSACQQHSAFEVVELRCLKIGAPAAQDSQTVDGIVVECCDGTVPSRSAVGVKNRERLLLLHGPGLLTPYEVRALRSDFPATPHQNSVRAGEPASLCLYFEPWSAVERTWTPAKHLQRILWWLRETALGTLHRSDQPLERLYFVSPFQIVLPADFKERTTGQKTVLYLESAGSRTSGTVLRGTFEANSEAAQSADTKLDTVVVVVPPVVSTRIERYPTTLQELHDQLVERGSGFHASLVEALKKEVPSSGLPIHKPQVKHTLLLLQVPVARDSQTIPERIDVTGFIVHDTSLPQLGIACGAAFDGKDEKVYAHNDLTSAGPPSETTGNWSELVIEPVDVRLALTPKDARVASGIQDDSANFKGVLAGVGALGSCMAELWCREGWGNWTFVDDDVLHAHNIVRHIGKDPHIGWAKVDVVANMAELTWPTVPRPDAIPTKVTAGNTAEVQSALSTASILIDATTTLEVPRDLSGRDNVPRMASVFLTPLGLSSVLLLEDAARNLRLSSLEAQYYRAILNSAWGPSHLVGHRGTYWVGAGCRDISGVLSQEFVQLHGATLAKQVRGLSARPEAQIRVWILEEESGAIAAATIPAQESRECSCGHWRIIWDRGLESKLRELRAKHLPNETGGIILGYIDQKLNAIYVVDVLPAPIDSIGTPTSFIRGTHGVKDSIERASELTANIVGYLGEWHSHPKHASAEPSVLDTELLDYLTEALAMDGVPALMAVVGETDVSISLDGGAAS